jgi:hypothetical protein
MQINSPFTVEPITSTALGLTHSPEVAIPFNYWPGNLADKDVTVHINVGTALTTSVSRIIVSFHSAPNVHCIVRY